MTRCTRDEHKVIFEGNSGIKSLIIIGLLALSTGCTSQPTVGPPVFIPQRTYISLPATLTAPTQVNLGDNPTWGSALGAYSEALGACNIDKTAISSLKPPPPYK